MMQGVRAAGMLLTRLPMGQVGSAAFAAAPGWFGMVGLALGSAQALVLVGAGAALGPGLGVLAALAAGAMLTGALHEDGLADTFDALGAPRPRERALEILRDSRIGVFGALALLIALAAQGLALHGLAGKAAVTLMAGQAISRLVLPVMLRHGPYVRAQGTGSGLTGPLPAGARLAWAVSAVAALALAGWGLGLAALSATVGALVGAAAIWAWARRRLGGVTGDILGAAQQMAFTGFVLGALAWG